MSKLHSKYVSQPNLTLTYITAHSAAVISLIGILTDRLMIQVTLSDPPVMVTPRHTLSRPVSERSR